MPADVDLDGDSWLSQINHPQWRKDELKICLDSLLECPLNEDDYENKMHQKDETYVRLKHARAINSRSDRFKVYSGPFFKQVEKIVYEHPAFIKHVPVKDRPKFIRDRLFASGGVYISTDYEAFESLFTKELMQIVEFCLYRHMAKNLPNRDDLIHHIESALGGTNVCKNKFFSVTVPATRMSGDMCTSLGNGITNLVAMEFVLWLLDSRGIGVVEGDDGLFRVDGPIPTDEHFRAIGLRIKIEVHNDLCSASFCGLIFDEIDLVNIVDPAKVLARFGWISAKYRCSKNSTKLKLLRCKALSLAYQYPGCPIIGELARYGLRVTRSIDVRGFVSQSRNLGSYERDLLSKALLADVPYSEPTMRTRILMENVFGITLELQRKIEGYLQGLTDLVELDIPLADMFMPAVWYEYYNDYVVVQNVDLHGAYFGIIQGFKPEF